MTFIVRTTRRLMDPSTRIPVVGHHVACWLHRAHVAACLRQLETIRNNIERNEP